jgi:D-sedoheptulose 7-phosphate isomerase
MNESEEEKMRAEARTAEHLRILVSRYPALAPLNGEIRRGCELLIDAFEAGRKLLVCGNGGSAADADHIVGELMKGFVLRRAVAPVLCEKLIAQDAEMGARMAKSLQQGLPAIALTQASALLSAFANDVDPALVYAQQVLGLGAAGDVFWGISTSGNAKNVLHAAVAARALGLKVLGMTGEGGGMLAKFCDVCIAAPERETYKVQELHLPIYHTICLAVEAALFS